MRDYTYLNGARFSINNIYRSLRYDVDSYLRKLLERRDHEAMEKELMYSSDKLKNRIADLDDVMMFCADAEAVKPAFLRKKAVQGRNTDSQK